MGLMGAAEELVQVAPVPDVPLDSLDRKMLDLFAGRVVRKDLVKRLKVGFNVPVYVLEYLLGKYCSTGDMSQIEEGLQLVKDTIAERFVRADQGELIKARLQRQGSSKLIDLVSVRFDEKDQGGKYWARLATSGLNFMHLDPSVVHRHERLLMGGIWANVELSYDETLLHGGVTRPFVLRRMAPIQIAGADFEEFVEARRRFSRDEWIDVLVRTMGYDPEHPDFNERVKWLLMLRLVPLVERNFNLVELGPRGTGKSFIFRELSPYVILLSGGQVTVPKLFVSNAPPFTPGLVTRWDVVAFDEVAGSHFRKAEDKQLYKDYMELGSFSRGSEKGTIQGDGSLVFNGNLDGQVEDIVRSSSHLFQPFPESIRDDMAFHDRWHAYLPGWELPKMQPDYFTVHLGFIADYLAEVFHNHLRTRNFTDAYHLHFNLGPDIEERDRKAAAKTVSGLVKLLHPGGDPTKDEVGDYLAFALEMRLRVKEQLKKLGPREYAKTDFRFTDTGSGGETIVCVPEHSAETPADVGAELSVERPRAAGRDTRRQVSILEILEGESAYVEFKESARWSHILGEKEKMSEEEVVRSIAGFMNRDGGTLLIGVNDEGQVVGLKKDFKSLQKRPDRDGFENWLTGLLRERLGGPAVTNLSVTFDDIEGTEICRIDVDPSPDPVFADQSIFYLRLNNTTQRLSGKEMLEYIKTRWLR